MFCPRCSTEAASSARYCPGCGDPLQHASVSPTRTHLEGASPGRSPSPARSPSFPRDASSSGGGRRGERFAPGFVLAERYRISGVLGRGGMGEVYRADDLMLEQTVALKFLPEALAADQERLARLLDEVRLTRQVSHPNVCRVYDAGRADSLHFLTMEFVDGEDLATLLRRIGHLPQDKAVEVARQICAGLSAAHERGVLHRDLKPANIMIDGRGKARITDFGLASLAEDAAVQGRSGTPAYMSPEQLQGEPASVRSDVYALGLVLHELFTGKPAFKAARSMEELIAIRRDSTSAVSPSSMVEALDPAVERTILRCLEPDPKARPASALAVAAALPGGDPLAAALAAGETPSPEMVAASGEEGTLSPVVGAALYAGFLLLIAGYALCSERLLLIHRIPSPKPPAVLADRAEEIVKKFSPALTASDAAFGFQSNSVYLDYLEKADSGPKRWDSLASGRPSAIQFWYRQGPRSLEALGQSGVVTAGDPPAIVPGMAGLVLDSNGRLMEMTVVPAQQDEVSGTATSPDYAALFAEAGLALSSFTSVPPRWVPPVYAGQRHAWEGSFPGVPETKIRVEAADQAGEAVYFQVLGPWSKPTRAEPQQPTRSVWWAQTVTLSFVVVLLGTGVLVARHNLKVGRGDRRGALRVSMYALLLFLAVWILAASHVPSLVGEWRLIQRALALGLYVGGLVWIFYIALEPFVRRRWPGALVSWTRLTAGRFRDPLVGRDLLIGFVAGAAVSFFLSVDYLLTPILGGSPPRPFPSDLGSLLGVRYFVAQIAATQLNAILNGMIVVALFFFFLWFLRRQWLATAAVMIVATALFVAAAGAGNLALDVALFSLCSAIMLATLMRFGLLSLIAAFFMLYQGFPLTFDPRQWYFGGSTVMLALYAGLGLYGFLVSRRGRGFSLA